MLLLRTQIIDGNVTTDSAMSRLADDCCERVLRGERLYVHCWGGHGRTGTLIATMLGRLYNLPYTTAIRYCQAFHDSRVYPQGVRSPQTPVQRAQVKGLHWLHGLCSDYSIGLDELSLLFLNLLRSGGCWPRSQPSHQRRPSRHRSRPSSSSRGQSGRFRPAPLPQ